MGKEAHSHFSKENIQTASRHLKRCLTSLTTRKIQIKAAVRSHFTPSSSSVPERPAPPNPLFLLPEARQFSYSLDVPDSFWAAVPSLELKAIVCKDMSLCLDPLKGHLGLQQASASPRWHLHFHRQRLWGTPLPATGAPSSPVPYLPSPWQLLFYFLCLKIFLPVCFSLSVALLH